LPAPTILIVEDEGLVGLELSQVLENMGYCVLPVVTSGKAAVASTEEHSPDLILMDIRLDGHPDGIETAKKIREDHLIPVIYLTAYADEATIQRAKTTGSYGYLIKPFEERSLRAAIEVALHKAQMERETEKEYDLNRAVVEHLNEGIIITDTSGTVKYVNAIARRMSGREEENWENQPLESRMTFLSPDTHAPIEPPFVRVGERGEPVVASCTVIRSGTSETIEIDYTMAPLKNKNGRVTGIVFLLKPVSGEKHTADAVRFELERSTKYQLNLLPDNGSRVHGVKTCWLFHPSIYGSGDVFNLFSLDATHAGFYLLDVMGHGFSAAVLAITIYSFLSNDIARLGILKRNFGSVPDLKDEQDEETGKSALILKPAEVIRELNSRFFFKANDNPFFTLVYGIIDTEKNEGVLARAGHPYPLLSPKDGEDLRLDPEGQAVGVFPEITVEERPFSFREGDRLFLYSDGLVDLFKSRETPSDEALIAFLGTYKTSSLERICDRLEEEVQRLHPDAEFTDDIAFFSLEMGTTSAESETTHDTGSLA